MKIEGQLELNLETPEQKRKRLVASITNKRGEKNPAYTQEELDFIEVEREEDTREREHAYHR